MADLRDDAEPMAAQIAAPPADPDLARLVEAWDGLPAPVRVGINAMVAVATGADYEGGSG